MDKEESHVLWTGGWDSTFRIVELLTQTDAVIQPHYILNPERDSAELEMRTMEKLRRLLYEKVPDAKRRLSPTLVTNMHDVPDDPRVMEALERLRSQRHVGLQNDYLARYAQYVVSQPLELCVERSDSASEAMTGRLLRSPGDGLAQYHLKDGDDDLATVFRWFRFPLAARDKYQMRDQARRWGMAAIMAKTWFCHRPVFGHYPCGTCRPCVYVMNKRQTWRMGILGRLRFTAIERPKRLIPPSAKAWLRRRTGRRLRSFLRA